MTSPTGGSKKGDPECGPIRAFAPIDAAWVYDLASSTLMPLEPPTIPRSGRTTTLLADGRVLPLVSHTPGDQDRTAELFQPVDSRDGQVVGRAALIVRKPY